MVLVDRPFMPSVSFSSTQPVFSLTLPSDGIKIPGILRCTVGSDEN